MMTGMRFCEAISAIARMFPRIWSLLLDTPPLSFPAMSLVPAQIRQAGMKVEDVLDCLIEEALESQDK